MHANVLPVQAPLLPSGPRLRILAWNVAGAVTALKASALLDAAEKWGAQVLLLQEVGRSAVWAGAVAETGGGYTHWELRLREAQGDKGGVAVAVRTDVPPFFEVDGEKGDKYALTLRLRLRDGSSAAGEVHLHVTSVYWAPSLDLESAAALHVANALSEGLSPHVLGGDVNAAFGSWGSSDEVLGPGTWVVRKMTPGYAHSEVGGAVAPATFAKYRKRAFKLLQAGLLGSMQLADGLLEPALPSRVARGGAARRAVGGTASHLTHVWISAGLRQVLASCSVLAPPGAQGEPAEVRNYAGLLLVGSDHHAVEMVLALDAAPEAAAPAELVPGGGFTLTGPPSALPKPDDVAGWTKFRAASRDTMLAALDGTYSEDVRGALAHEAVGVRRVAVNGITEAVTAALLAAGRTVRVQVRAQRQPQIPADVLRFAEPMLRQAAADLRQGGPAAGTALTTAAGRLRTSSLAQSVQAAASAAAVHRGITLSNLRKHAAQLSGSILAALAKAVGAEPPQRAPCALPRRLTRQDGSVLLCPPGASLAQCGNMLVALQEELLRGAGAVGAASISAEAGSGAAAGAAAGAEAGEAAAEAAAVWREAPAAPAEGAAPGLDFDALRAVKDGPASVAAPAERLHERVSVGEVAAAVRAMKRRKSHGMDRLRAEHLKGAHPVVLHALAWLLSAVLHARVLPDLWQCGRLIAVPKRAGASSKRDFRPLTMGATLRKLLATVLLRRLAAAAARHGVPGDSQHGYIAHRNVDTALLALRGHLSAIRTAGAPAPLLLSLDIAAAFDTLPRSVLRELLVVDGWQHPADVAALAVLYQRAEARLEAATPHGTLAAATCASVHAGVAQGCPLSGLLFVLALNEVEEAVAELVRGGSLHFPVGLVLYCDDVQLCVGDAFDAALVMRAVLTAVSSIGLQLSLHKCAVLRLGAPLDHGAAAEEQLDLGLDGGVTLPVRNTLKVLGVLLDCDADGLGHARWRVQLTVAMAYRLHSEGLNAERLPADLLRAVWTTYLQPLLLSGCEQVLSASVGAVLDAGQRTAICVLVRGKPVLAGAPCIYRELAVPPARALHFLRGVALAARATEHLGGSAAAAGVQQLLDSAPAGALTVALRQAVTAGGVGLHARRTQALRDAQLLAMRARSQHAGAAWLSGFAVPPVSFTCVFRGDASAHCLTRRDPLARADARSVTLGAVQPGPVGPHSRQAPPSCRRGGAPGAPSRHPPGHRLGVAARAVRGGAPCGLCRRTHFGT